MRTTPKQVGPGKRASLTEHLIVCAGLALLGAWIWFLVSTFIRVIR